MRNYKVFLVMALSGSFFWCVTMEAQDTIRYMHYNLLDYGNTLSSCNSSNNDQNQKDLAFRTLISYLHPDIVGVVEMGNSNALCQHLLDSAMNMNGIHYYQKASYTNYASSSIVNMLYFNSQKLVLKSQDVVLNTLRDINIYTLYYKAPNLQTTHDTVYLTAIVAHLKAGSTLSDQNERAIMTSQVMQYLSISYQPGNYVFSGDFNLTAGSAEQAYQNLLDFSIPDFRFFDPVNTPGNWAQNAAFAELHTISTHATSNGCASGFGFDSRFDFILVSGKVLHGLEKIRALSNTYHAVGQDGQHFQESVNGPPANTSVPSNVLNALYTMSDHLPVVMDMQINYLMGMPQVSSSVAFNVLINNHVGNEITCNLQVMKKTSLRLEILSVAGSLIVYRDLGMIENSKEFSLPLEKLSPGMYFLRLSDNSGNTQVRKLIKQ